jgi:hypothetical protein
MLKCGNCGKELKLVNKGNEPAYLKLILWPQYNPWSLSWVKQHYLGDAMVERFCDGKCFKEFAQAGRLKELVRERA